MIYHFIFQTAPLRVWCTWAGRGCGRGSQNRLLSITFSSWCILYNKNECVNMAMGHTRPLVLTQINKNNIILCYYLAWEIRLEWLSTAGQGFKILETSRRGETSERINQRTKRIHFPHPAFPTSPTSIVHPRCAYVQYIQRSAHCTRTYWIHLSRPRGKRGRVCLQIGGIPRRRRIFGCAPSLPEGQTD